MGQKTLVDSASRYLDHLCSVIATRTVGTQGNRDATAYFHQQIKQFDFSIEQQPFDCIESKRGRSTMKINSQNFAVLASPLTLGCECEAEMVQAQTVTELEELACTDRILLLHEEIAKEQLMPKGFEFYNPEEHQHIIQLLEQKQPAAILSATSKNPDLAGAIYPFPMIVDGDFDIPSAYMKDIQGEELLPFCGQKASLAIKAERSAATGENIVAWKGSQEKKVVICAHIDTKENTPGALDNASGVVILMLLAELLSDYAGSLGIELVAFNGEEYYSTPGEITYLEKFVSDFSPILLAINLDDIGYIHGRSAFSFYGVPDSICSLIRNVYHDKPGFFEGPAWYQSDHGIFMAKGIPAMAVTEEDVLALMADITHTEKDVPEIIDRKKLVENAQALKDILHALDEHVSGIN